MTGYHERPIYSVDYKSTDKLLMTCGGDDTMCLYG